MAEFSPAPSPAFSGIDFNPSFFPSTTSDYVEFPTAQGTVTFGTIFATTIDTPTPSADFDFLDSEIGNINIGTSVPAGQTIKLGQNTGASIHCGSIDLQGTNINNSVASDTGIISLAPKQTTGTLNIGSHPTTGTRTTGGINIATNSVGITPIIIGTTGQTTTTLRGTTVDVVTKITAPTVDATLDTTNMTIGSNLRGGNLTIGGSSGHTGTINLGSAQTTGALNIGNGSRTGAGAINIGNQATGTIAITIGTTGQSTTTLNGTNVTATTKLTTPILDCVDAGSGNTSLSIGPSATSGNIVIGAALGVGDLSIGVNQSVGGTVTIGSSSTVTTLNGSSVTATTKLLTPTLDCVTDAGSGNTSLAIGGSATSGNIVIGAALGVGDISIATAQSSGGTITLGSSSTATTVSNTLGVTGRITASGGLTMSGTSGITLPTVSYTPTSAQLGYISNIAGTTVSGIGTTATNVWTIPANQPIGIYLVSFSVQLTSWSAGATQSVTHSTTTTACDVGVQFFNTPGTTIAGGNGETFSGILKYTAATNAFVLRLATNTGTVTATSPSYTLTRIA